MVMVNVQNSRCDAAPLCRSSQATKQTTEYGAARESIRRNLKGPNGSSGTRCSYTVAWVMYAPSQQIARAATNQRSTVSVICKPSGIACRTRMASEVDVSDRIVSDSVMSDRIGPTSDNDRQRSYAASAVFLICKYASTQTLISHVTPSNTMCALSSRYSPVPLAWRNPYSFVL